jgi:hypothetical protein
MKEIEPKKTDDVSGGQDVLIPPGPNSPFVPFPGMPSDPLPAPLTDLPQ